MTTQIRSSWWWKVGLASALATGTIVACFEDRVLAQSKIVPDQTLGTESSNVVPNFGGFPVEAIGGGAVRGANLFHSFQEFNVSEGRGAYFFSPSADIQNILARVTGSNRSEILGTLGTLGGSDPNLFLMNSNGIVFGPKASLDVGGSFVATTANAVQLGDAGLFSASEPATSNLLSVNPSVLFFNALASQAQITNRSTATSPVLGFSLNGLPSTDGLQVPDGRSLLLVGSDVSLEDGGRLNALGGRVELGGLAEAGAVELETNGNTFSLNFTPNSLLSDVTLADDAQVSVQGLGSGDILVNANNFKATDGGRLVAGTAGLGNAGDILVNANNFSLSGVGLSGQGSGLYNQSLLTASANAGDIFVNAKTFSALSGGTVSSITNGSGNAGNIRIASTNSAELVDGYIQALAESSATGNAGDIFVDTGTFTTSGPNGFLFSSSNGTGNSGDINVSANSIGLLNGSSIYSAAGGFGNAGNISIVARDSVELANGYIQTTTGPTAGDAGKISVATGIFTASGENGFLWSSSSSNGSSGDISISGNSVSLLSGSSLDASALGGSSNAGNVSIVARDSVELANGYIQTTAESSATGDAGNISIAAGTFRASGKNGFLWSGTNGGGRNGGDVSVKADSVEFLNRSGVDSSIRGGSGNAGKIEINTDFLQLENSSYIDTQARNFTGTGGNVFISTNKVDLLGNSSIKLGSLIQGDAGNLFMQANDSIFLSNSSIEAGSGGRGGDINLQAGSLVSLTNYSSVKTASADAGSISITAPNINILEGSQLRGGIQIGLGSPEGRAGNIVLDGIDGTGTINIGGSSTIQNIVNLIASGSGGDVIIKNAQSLSLTDGAQILVDTLGNGNAGNVNINIRGPVSLTTTKPIDLFSLPSGIFSGALSAIGLPGGGDQGKGGDIQITANSLSLTNGSEIDAQTSGREDAGSVIINVRDTVSLDGVNNGVASQISTATFSSGNGGNITINTNSLEATNGGQFLATTEGDGRAGNITVNATESFSLSNGAQLSTSTFGQGNAGNVLLKTDGSVSLTNNSGIFSTVESGAEGNSGSINVEAESLSLADDAQLQTLVRRASDTLLAGRGNAGNVTINVRGAATFSGANSGFRSGIASSIDEGATGEGGDIEIKAGLLSLADGAQLRSALELGAVGKGGDINIETGSLSLTNAAELVANTSGTGDAGNIFIRADNSISAANRSGIFTTVGAGAVGNGGVIDVQAKSLDLSGGSQLQAIIFREQNGLSGGQGRGGDIQVKTTDFVSLSGVSPDGFSSGLLTSTEKGAVGPAGSITVETDTFRIADGAVVDALTANSGRAGDIIINANTFEATGGGQVLTTTRSSGRAGDINLNIADSVTISGSDPTFASRLAQFGEDIVNNQGPASGVFANTASSSTGNGGSISIGSTNLNLTDSAQISAQSQGTKEAGNVTINATGLISANNGSITAAAAQAGGGEIDIAAGDIRLRGDSDIRTDVNSGAGGGGDISIRADSLVAFDDSDILAFARDGQGGDITLNTPAFLGENFQPAPANTNPDSLNENSRVDVNASGAVAGVVSVPDVSFIQNSLTELPDNPVATETLIANSCVTPSNQPGGTFIITGAGGLPTRPGDASVSPYSTGEVRSVPSNAPSSSPGTTRTWQKGDPIVEPTGTYRLASGKLVMSRECSNVRNSK